MFTNIQSIFSASSYKKYTAIIIPVIISLLCFQGISVTVGGVQGATVGERVILSMAEGAVGLAIEGEAWAEDGGEAVRNTDGSLVDIKSGAIIEPGKTSTAKAAESDVPGLGTQILNGGINVLFALLTPFLILAGWLLSPDWVFGEVFGLRPILYELWKLMSNIVYVAFAFLLIVMAFMNIYGGEKNAWAIKTKLPKLIIGVISVPFTWFFVSAIISISTILTASTIQLAGDLSMNIAPTSEFKFQVPEKCTLNFDGVISGTGSVTKFYECSKVTENTPKTDLSALLRSENPYGVVSYYAYAVFKVDKVKDIKGVNLSTIKSIGDLTMGLFIALLVFLIFMLISAMLILALFMRAIHFWMIAIFSPLLSLKYFLEDKMSFGDKWLSVPKIISLAMVPVYVSAALAFGLVFISAIGGAKMQTSPNTTVKIVDNKMTAFGTEYTVTGKPVWFGDTNTSATNSLSGNVFGQLIIYFLGLAVLWIAVTAAVNSSEITKEAAQPVAEFGNQIGGIIKKLPQYAPIIPTGHGHANLSLSNLSSLGSGITNSITARGQADAQRMGQGIAESIGFKTDPTVGAMRTELSKFPKIQAETLANAFEGVLRQSGVKTTTDFTKQTDAQKQVYIDMISRIDGINPDKKKELEGYIKSKNVEDIRKLFHNIDNQSNGRLGVLGTTDLDSIPEIDTYLKGLQAGKESSTATAQSTITTPSNQPITNLLVTINGSTPDIKLNMNGRKPTKITDDSKAELNRNLGISDSLTVRKDKLKAALETTLKAANENRTQDTKLSDNELKSIIDDALNSVR